MTEASGWQQEPPQPQRMQSQPPQQQSQPPQQPETAAFVVLDAERMQPVVLLRREQHTDEMLILTFGAGIPCPPSLTVCNG